jgi:hypothetical protein
MERAQEPPKPRRGPPDPRDIELLDEDYVEFLRSKTPTERIGMALQANRNVRLRLEIYFRSVHPDWNDEQISAAIARRMLYGTDP